MWTDLYYDKDENAAWAQNAPGYCLSDSLGNQNSVDVVVSGGGCPSSWCCGITRQSTICQGNWRWVSCTDDWDPCRLHGIEAIQ